jgi:hypothetical protein
MRNMHPVTTIAGGSYGPTELQQLVHIFDEVWASLAIEGVGRGGAIAAERTRLATIVLALSHDKQLSAFQIARTASRLMREPGAR